jgi:hypothetical protein
MANGNAEGLVGYSRRNFMVPIPRFATWDAFNDYLETQCLKRQTDVLRGQSETIGQRLERDLAAMSDLPAAPFDACDQATGRHADAHHRHGAREGQDRDEEPRLQ